MKFTILLPQLIYTFGFTTHRYLGGLLERTLDPNTVSRIKTIANETDLSELSTWADRVKYTHEYYWTKPLHYLDIPVCNKFDLTQTDIEKICKNRCIYSAINNFTNNMNDPDNIKFLIHFRYINVTQNYTNGKVMSKYVDLVHYSLHIKRASFIKDGCILPGKFIFTNFLIRYLYCQVYLYRLLNYKNHN